MSGLSQAELAGLVARMADGAFPSGPVVGQRCFRWDLGWECFWDGTRWLTVQEFTAQFSGEGISATWRSPRVPLRSDYAFYATRAVWTMQMYGAAHDGSNYYAAAWRSCNDDLSAATSLATLATTGAGFQHADGAPAVASSANKRFMDVSWTKVGSPSDCNIYLTGFYRLIVT